MPANTPFTSAIDVAKYFVLLACNQQDEPDCLTHMRVQKLLYYVQGWHLAMVDRPLFNEPIEAWAYGPVIPAVYQEFREFGRGALPEECGSDENLSEPHKAFIRSVWDIYKPYSALALSDMTHSERPWKETRGGLPREAKCDREITHELMADFFKELAKS